MARIKFTNTFAAFSKLLYKIVTKDTADGVDSEIRPCLVENSIVLADDKTATDDAVAADDLFSQATKDSEKFREQRDGLFKNPFRDHRKCVQFLKKLYVGNVHKLGDWSVTVVGGKKIEYPADFDDNSQGVLDFIDYHLGLAVGTSPLLPFLAANNIDISVNRGKIVDARTAHTSFKSAETTKETKKELRDSKFSDVEAHIRLIGGFLMSLHPDSPKKVGAWSFQIDNSPQGTKFRTVVVNEGAERTVHDAVQGSILKNEGARDVNIYAGKTTEGALVVLQAGKSMVIKKGFGTFTAQNTFLDGKITLTVEVNK